jgi:exodeoxyribonuclease V alpha subunit
LHRGYAGSIHKAQGGEFKHVIAIIVKRMGRTFGKPALYTAFSKAKQTLTVVGETDAIPYVAEQWGQKRTTALAKCCLSPGGKTKDRVAG